MLAGTKMVLQNQYDIDLAQCTASKLALFLDDKIDRRGDKHEKDNKTQPVRAYPDFFIRNRPALNSQDVTDSFAKAA